MNSKVLVVVVMLISASLGVYIGMNQISSQKNDKIITSNNLQSSESKNSGDVFIDTNDVFISGDINTNSGEIDSRKCFN